MKRTNLVDWLSHGFARFGVFCYDHRVVVFVVSVLLLGACTWLAFGVRYDNSFEAYFDRGDPVYSRFLEFREDFGSDEISYILYEAPDYEHGPWNIKVMKTIQDLTETLEDEVPFVKEVTSLTNVEFIEGVPGELLIYDLLEEFPETQQELLALRDKVLKKPLYVGGIVSEDARYAAIILEMEKASVDPPEEIRLDPDKGNELNNLYPQATYNVIEEILARPEYADITFYHTGDVPLNARYNQVTQSESVRLGIMAFVVVGLVLVVFFRRTMGVVGPMSVVLLSIVIALAFVSLMGWNLDLMVIMLPPLLIAVGVADSVHVLSEFDHYHVSLGDRRKAVEKTVYLVGVPCLFTTMTTVAGLSSMAVSPIKAIWHFALYSAVGVAAAFVLTLSLLVVFLSFGKRKVEKHKAPKALADSAVGGIIVRGLGACARFDIRHPVAITVVGFAALAFFGAGFFMLEVDTSFLSEFSPQSKIRRVTEKVDGVMGGSGSFYYVYDTGEPGGIKDPAVLREMERLQRRAELDDHIVMKTYSVVDLLCEINKSFHNEDPAYYRLPETRELVAQYLLLYEMSGGDELTDYVSTDYSRANLEIRCKMLPTSQFKRLATDLEKFAQALPDRTVDPGITGMGALWIKLIDYIVQSQIYGFLLAFSVIAVMMCVVFQSVRVGLVSMIPNLTPVVVTLGMMGWAGISLDYVKLLIGCVAIGIAVDDTVHLVSRFRHEFLLTGSYHQALKNSMGEVGRALFITTVVLVAGFSLFLLSVMQTLQSFGLLVATTVLVALIADFLLLPALFLLFKPFGKEGVEEQG